MASNSNSMTPADGGAAGGGMGLPPMSAPQIAELQRLASAYSATGGYVLMPKHPTRAMVDAADACTDAYSAYNAMVEAAHVR